MINIRHQVPGRIRLQVIGLARNPALGPRIVALLRSEPGVHRVRANPSGSSLVVHFAPGSLDGITLKERLSEWVRTPASCPKPEPNLASFPRNRTPRGRVLRHRSPDAPTRMPADVAGEKADKGAITALIAPTTAVRWRHRLGRAWGGARGLAGKGLAQDRRTARRFSVGCRLCRLYARVSRWIVAMTLRCWWRDLRLDAGGIACSNPGRRQRHNPAVAGPPSLIHGRARPGDWPTLKRRPAR
jgi:hypothetical protein